MEVRQEACLHSPEPFVFHHQISTSISKWKLQKHLLPVIIFSLVAITLFHTYTKCYSSVLFFKRISIFFPYSCLYFHLWVAFVHIFKWVLAVLHHRVNTKWNVPDGDAGGPEVRQRQEKSISVTENTMIIVTVTVWCPSGVHVYLEMTRWWRI